MVGLCGLIRQKSSKPACLQPYTNSKGMRNVECTLLDWFVSGFVDEQLLVFCGHRVHFATSHQLIKPSQYGIKTRSVETAWKFTCAGAS